MPDSTIILVMKQPGGVTDYAQVVADHMTVPVRVQAFEPDMQLPDGAAVLLHYSGYGYAKRGAPLHLLAWARRNRARMRRFGVFFHELYATGKPTSSAFWLSPVQRYVASRLARICDFWLTNIEDSEGWLLRHAGQLPHRRLAIPSNIGEAASFATERRPVAVVFGSVSLRVLTYRAAGDALFRWAGEQGVEIHDIGSPITEPDVAEAMQRHGVVAHGRLETEAIQRIMAGALFGLTRYPPRFVAKSSVLGGLLRAWHGADRAGRHARRLRRPACRRAVPARHPRARHRAPRHHAHRPQRLRLVPGPLRRRPRARHRGALSER